jgi:galactokinase
VVTESARVLDAADALWYRDHSLLGTLVSQTHASLRDDYEVSSPELDLMADLCSSVDGVFGARLIGAGFGGSVLALTTPSAVDRLRTTVEAEYPKRSERKATVIDCRVGNGARALVLS